MIAQHKASSLHLYTLMHGKQAPAINIRETYVIGGLKVFLIKIPLLSVLYPCIQGLQSKDR